MGLLMVTLVMNGRGSGCCLPAALKAGIWVAPKANQNPPVSMNWVSRGDTLVESKRYTDSAKDDAGKGVSQDKLQNTSDN